ncbi:YnbE family lipoprotein [Victivallis vadensis]|uniref:YnbE family lipoprotein n=1 Tax=Victivallis vadensis TaxID=172901 RepID=UPI0001571519|nr:YnbE family lipoprotein [Victivallis vadensis]
MRYVPLFLAAAVGAAVCGCTPTIKTESEVTIKPVQIDLNVNLKVDKELTQALSPDSKPDLKADPNSSDGGNAAGPAATRSRPSRAPSCSAKTTRDCWRSVPKTARSPIRSAR